MSSVGKENQERSSFRSSLTEKRSELTKESSKFDGGTYTLRSKSGDRKSLIDDGRWLSLDRKGRTSKTSSSSAAVSSQQTTSEKKKSSKSPPKSPSRSPSRGKSQEREGDKDESGDARAFWISLDSSQSKEQSRVSQERKTSRKMSRSSTERKTSKAAQEPPVDYNVDKKNSKIKRGSQVTKRKSEVGMESKQSDERYSMNTVNNNDYNRGSPLTKDGNYPIAKLSTNDESHSNNSTMKRNTNSMSRRGTIYDENINRDGFGRDINNAVVKRNRSNSNADESKHFLSLQLFNKVKSHRSLKYLKLCFGSTLNLHLTSFFLLSSNLNLKTDSVKRRMLCTGNFCRCQG